MTHKLRHDTLEQLEKWQKLWLGQKAGQDAYYLRMKKLAQTHHAPFSRASFEPGHFTASGFVVDASLSKVLLVLHRKLKRWLQPGGHFEPGDDSSLAAACREVREETGIVANVFKGFEGPYDLDIHAIPAHAKEASHLHYDLRFVLCAQNLELEQNDEVEDACFCPFDRVEDLSTDQSVVRVIKHLQTQKDRLVAIAAAETKWSLP